MKICIPSQDGRGFDSSVHAHFGSAPWFTFVDTDTNEVVTQANPSCGNRPGSCHHVGMLARRGVEVVVSSGIGRRALEGLAEAGIEVLAAPRARVGAVVEMAKTDQLEHVRSETACAGGFHRGRGQGHRHAHGHRHGGDCRHD